MTSFIDEPRTCDMCADEPAHERMMHEGRVIAVGEKCFWAMMGD